MHLSTSSYNEDNYKPITQILAKFDQENFNALQLLNIQGITNQVRRQNQQFTHKLLEHQNIMKQLIDICTKPQIYQKNTQNIISSNITYRAIEILSSLSDEFSDRMFQQQACDQADDEDNVVTDIIFDKINPHTIFLHLLSVLDEQQTIQETPLAYFSRLLVSLCYQKPKQVLQFFSHPQMQKYTDKLLRHNYSKSITDIVIRLLEIEDSEKFYDHEKIGILIKYQKSIENQGNPDKLAAKIENYEALLENMHQKIDDRFDKTKFAVLVTQYFSQKSIPQFLITNYEKNSKNLSIVTNILQIVCKLLSFSTGNRHLPTPSKNSKIHNKLFDDHLQNSVEEIKLCSELIQQLAGLITRMKQDLYHQNPQKFFVIQYLTANKYLLNTDRHKIFKQTIEPRFLNRMIQLGIKFPNNNTIHNLIKDIIIICINHDLEKTTDPLLDINQNLYLNLASRITQKNSSFPFQNQLYHIHLEIIKKAEQDDKYQAMLQKNSDLYDISARVKRKQQFYNHKICGGMRKQSSNWGDSSSEIVFDRFLTNISDKKEQSKNILDSQCAQIQKSQDHWIDSELPLDSDSQKDLSGNLCELKVNSQDPRSPFTKQKSQLLQNALDSPTIVNNFIVGIQELNQEPDSDFTSHFSSYLSYDVDQILSEIE